MITSFLFMLLIIWAAAQIFWAIINAIFHPIRTIKLIVHAAFALCGILILIGLFTGI